MCDCDRSSICPTIFQVSNNHCKPHRSIHTFKFMETRIRRPISNQEQYQPIRWWSITRDSTLIGILHDINGTIQELRRNHVSRVRRCNWNFTILYHKKILQPTNQRTRIKKRPIRQRRKAIFHHHTGFNQIIQLRVHSLLIQSVHHFKLRWNVHHRFPQFLPLFVLLLNGTQLRADQCRRIGHLHLNIPLSLRASHSSCTLLQKHAQKRS